MGAGSGSQSANDTHERTHSMTPTRALPRVISHEMVGYVRRNAKETPKRNRSEAFLVSR